jgi:G3E family GTPase
MTMTTKITIISGFLGAGKTTIIKKMLVEKSFGTHPVLVENDYGAIGIDADILSETGIIIKELTAGCICCSSSGSFVQAIDQILTQYHPEHLLIEPSGVGKLSEIQELLRMAEIEPSIEIGGSITVVDAKKFRKYEAQVFEYLGDQISHADIVVLNKVEGICGEELLYICDRIHEINPHGKIAFFSLNESCAHIVDDLLNIAHSRTSYPRVDCNQLHCTHEHGHHHGETAFEHWSQEVTSNISAEGISDIFNYFDNAGDYGTIYRAKGIIKSDNKALLVDYVPLKGNIVEIDADDNGKIMIIGQNLNKGKLEELFY